MWKSANLNKEKELSYESFVGVDEVGRGALAGPVLAAAVKVKYNQVGEIPEIYDSKVIPKKKREELAMLIKSQYPYSFGSVSNTKIDQINILNASLLAMRKAILKLEISNSLVLIDGAFKIPKQKYIQECYKKGDQIFYSIAAASIIAKVERDMIMERFESKHKNFAFSMHSGYGTKRHKEEIKNFGITEIHRKTFKNN